jgi:Mn2+/Fe2+ NRAMP family transporter
MGELVNRRLVVLAAGLVTALIIGLNVYLLASA